LTTESAPGFRYIAHKRRTKEDRRFIAGAGRFVADISLPGMLHVALVASPYPCAASSPSTAPRPWRSRA
jgi:2-furoyl-CoA dehydrogenase large subunit